MYKNIINFIELLDKSRKAKFFSLIFFIFIATIFETLSFGAIFPVILIILEPTEIQRFNFINFKSYSHNSLIVFLLSFLMIIFLLKNIISGIIYYFQSKFTFGIMSFLSKKLYSKYIDQDYSEYLENNSSTYIKNTLGEVQNLIDYFVKPILILFSECILLLCFLILSLIIEPLGTVFIATIFLIVFSFFNLFTKKYITYMGRLRQSHEKLRIQILQESFGSIKLIKLNDLKKYFSSKFVFSTEQASKSAGTQDFLLTLPRFFLEYILVLSVSVFIIIFLQFNETPKVLIPKIGLLLIIAFRLLPSVNRVQNSIQNLRYSSPFIANISKELIQHKENFIKISKMQSKEAIKFNNLEFKDVSFDYNNKKEIFRKKNIIIEKNSTNLITGISGSGKTTFIDLVMGFHKPNKGKILINKNDIFSFINSFQSIISYVPQNIFLIDNTIEKNIALGIEDKFIDKNLLYESIKLSNLNDLIANNDNGLKMMIGENGNKLSGGQKQRIGIARAIYRKSSILIMDEPTSSLDFENSKNIFDTICKLKSKMTIIVISHEINFENLFENVYKISNKNLIKI
mgnify:FL=1